MNEERRCPRCAALVADDADWCGQCFGSLRPPPGVAPPPPSVSVAPGTSEGAATRADPYWPCGACGGRNAIEADACTTCGTPFAQLMRGEPTKAAVDPPSALTRSLLFPGLGHLLVGRGADGLARGVLFVITCVMAVLTGLANRTAITTVTFFVFLGAAIATYVGTALEAKRLAGGGGLLVSSRTLLWGVVALVVVSLVLLAVSVVGAVRG